MKPILALAIAWAFTVTLPGSGHAAPHTDAYLCAHGDQNDFYTIQACDRKDAASDPALAQRKDNGASEKTSFNCGRAQSFAETTICHDPALAAMDRDLSTVYRRALAADLSGSVKSGERAAWREREACQTRDCLVNWYSARRASLTASNAAAAPTPEGGANATDSTVDASSAAPEPAASAPSAAPAQIATPAPEPATSSGNAIGAGLLVMMIIVIFLSFYFAPTMIALARMKRNLVAIFALNLLLGWTFIGWVAAFVWSLTVEAGATQPRGLGGWLGAKIKEGGNPAEKWE